MERFKHYLPNFLTLLRIPSAAGFLVFHLYGRPMIALACFVAGCLTDYFDGFLARLWSVTSNFGKVADAYCDKAICWVMTLVVTSLYGTQPIIIAIIAIQLAYDGGLSVLRYVLGHVNIPVNQYAKCKTTCLMFGFIVLYVGWMLGSPAVALVAYAILLAAIVLAIMSIATYLRGYKLGWLIPYPLSIVL